MIQEFYFRSEEDPNYKDDIMRVSDEMEALNYQIHMTIGTTQGDVLGEEGFGANPEDMLFSVNYNMDEGVKRLYEQLGTYSSLAKNYQLSIDPVKYIDGYKEVGVFDIKVGGKSVIGYSYGTNE